MEEIIEHWYSKDDYSKNVLPYFVRELFSNSTSMEIIKFLKNDYNSNEFRSECNKSNEKILLDLNNELINKHLIRYCKSENTFYYLLELDSSFINQAIFNINIGYFKNKKIIEILLNNKELLKVFFENLIENIYSISYSKYLILSLINEKEILFDKLSNDEYISLLKIVLPHNNLLKIIKEEIEDDDVRFSRYHQFQKSIWNLLCDLEVDENSIELFSKMGKIYNVHLDTAYDKNHTIEDILKKWSDYDYKEINKDEDYKPYIDYNDKLNVQMFISLYNISDLKDLMTKYDGVKAYLYKYRHWTNLTNWKTKLKDYKEFIENELLQVGEKYISNETENPIKFFILNKSNYEEAEYFKIFKEYFEADGKLVIENFEKICKAFLEDDNYGLYEIENLFEEQELEIEKRQYYLDIYHNYIHREQLEKELSDKFLKEKDFYKLAIDLQTSKNRKDKLFFILLILLNIIIIIFK